MDCRPGSRWSDPGPSGDARRYVLAPADPAHLDAQQTAVGSLRRGRRNVRDGTARIAPIRFAVWIFTLSSPRPDAPPPAQSRPLDKPIGFVEQPLRRAP